MAHMDIPYQPDQVRRSTLSVFCRVGQAEVYGETNSCLADSLLQVLMWHDVLTLPVFASEHSHRKWRREPCVAVRAFVCSHSQARSDPVQQDHTNSMLRNAFAEEHALAFLAHHCHAAPILHLY